MKDLIKNSFSVCKFDNRKAGYVKLYECIENIGDALILAQYAMSQKEPNELVFIFPGWNLGINNGKYKEEYEKALILAKKYAITD